MTGLQTRVVPAAVVKSVVLPLKAPPASRIPSASFSVHPTSRFTTSASRTNNNMANSKSNKVSEPPQPPRWQQISWQKKDEQFARIPHEWRLPNKPTPDVTNYLDIPRTCGILSPEELKITEDYDATAFAEAIRSRKLKCIDVTRAFCKVRSSHSHCERSY